MAKARGQAGCVGEHGLVISGDERRGRLGIGQGCLAREDRRDVGPEVPGQGQMVERHARFGERGP